MYCGSSPQPSIGFCGGERLHLEKSPANPDLSASQGSHTCGEDGVLILHSQLSLSSRVTGSS